MSPDQKKQKLQLQSSPAVKSKLQNIVKSHRQPQKKTISRVVQSAQSKNAATSRKDLHQKKPSLNLETSGSFQQQYWANVSNPYGRLAAQTSRANLSKADQTSGILTCKFLDYNNVKIMNFYSESGESASFSKRASKLWQQNRIDELIPNCERFLWQ